MNYQDIILEVFEIDDDTITLEEGIPITPLLALSVFKDDFFKKGKAFGTYLPKKAEKAVKKAQAKGKVFKEKARAEFGVQTGETVYKLTDEQREVIKDLYSKYGKNVVNDVRTFRRNVLAPYALIKRSVKSGSRISSKDITGMSKEQFISALESGRKKIEARGESQEDKSKDLQRIVSKHSEQVKNLQKAKSSIDAGRPIEQSILNRLYSEFEVSDKDLQGYSADELRSTFNTMARNFKSIEAEKKKFKAGEGDVSKAMELTKSQRELRAGKSIDLTKTEKDKFYKGGNFNVALGKYFLRRDIVNKLKPGQNNTYRKTYDSIIDEMLKRVSGQRKKSLEKLISLRKTTAFNDKESKIWEKRPTVKYESNKISDYFQKIKEEDFLEKQISIEKNPKVKKAEREIENEIKRFERSLIKKIDPSDVEKLKRYRLINNLISVRELENPSKMFKSVDQIGGAAGEKEAKKYISPDEYTRKVKEIATREYDTISELNKAKKEAKELTKQMKEAKEDKVVKEMKNVLRQIDIRRDLEATSLLGRDVDKEIIIDINDIEKLVKDMLKKDYEDDFDKQKQDKVALKKMISKYKEEDPDAEDNLEDLEDLIGKLDIKLKRGGRI